MNFNFSEPMFRHAQSDGTRLALSVGDQNVSYSELAVLAQRMAAWLNRNPARPRGFVAILASRSMEAYVGVLGTGWGGDAYVPINPKLPEDRIATLLEIIQPVALVTDESGRKALTGRAFDAAPAMVLNSFDDLPAHDPQDRPRQMEVQEKQLTMWTSVPSTAVFLERMKMLQPGSLPSLRYTIFSGEPLPLRSALAWQQAAPNSVVDNILGHTECCCFSTLERLSDPPNVTPKLGLVAVGKPLPGFEAAVFDKDYKPLPPGQEGELALAGPQVAQGYFQDAERTAVRFPVIDGKVWYRTGDLAVVDELGSLHHLGRIDNQVKVLGHRIELGEVESHLAAICSTDAVAAVAWPVEHGSARGIAAFHCAESLSAQEIRDKMALRVPRYMVPQQVRCLERIPLTEQGKIDRAALKALLDLASDGDTRLAEFPAVTVR